MSASNHQDVRHLVAHIFDITSEEAIDAITAASQDIHVKSGETLIQQGDSTDSVYLLLSGRLGVHINQDGNDVLVNYIHRGEFFGEMAILTQSPRSSTIKAVRDCFLLEIKGKNFSLLLDRHPIIYQALNRTLMERIRVGNDSRRIKKTTRSVGIFNIVDGIDLSSLVKNVYQGLKAHQSCILLSENELAQLISSSDNSNDIHTKISRWLSEIETQYDLVLFQGSDQNQEWNEMICRNTDMILWSADGNGSPQNSGIESALSPLLENQEQYLLLQQSSTENISNTRSWLEKRPQLKGHFHLINPSDEERLVRFLSNRSVQLVLGGGGARGMAHLGVLKAMKELKIPVDFVGGTSIGSIMAALSAADWPLEASIEMAYEAFVKSKPLSDYSFPMVSLLKGRKLNNLLQKYFGHDQIEDMRRPYFAVASDFSNACIEVIDSGDIWKAIRASISLPTILPPMVKGNSLLLDGGIVDNLPYDHMTSLAQGKIIGVDLSKLKKRTLNYEEMPGNLSILWDKMTGKRKIKAPNIFQIVMGTLTLASDDKRRANKPKFDLYLEPEVGKFGFMGWKDFHKIVEAGYVHALEVLGETETKKSKF